MSVQENAAGAGKPKRNPVERAIVWGGIGIMIVLACTEGLARYGYSATLAKLNRRLDEDDSDNHNPLQIEEASKIISGFPSKDEADGQVTYHWKGLIKHFGSITLTIDDEGTVLSYATANPPEPEVATVATGDDESSEAEMGMMMGGGPGAGPPGGGGNGGGGRNFDPMQSDTDGDGKLSLEEAPERMKENFAAIDTNGDGFIDAAELEARRAARAAAGEGGDRPQRPDADTESSAPSADTTKPAEDSKLPEQPEPGSESQEATTEASEASTEQ